MFECLSRDPLYDLNTYDYLANNPHTLIGGSTGCGKSVMIDTLMYSILTDNRRGASPIFFLIDPKRVSLNKYKGIKAVHRYGCDYGESKAILEDVIRQMEFRYRYMQSKGQTMIAAVDMYVVIDELADLLTMPQSRKEIKPLIQRIAQLGRAARVHLIAATQCPARKIIPAELTLNFTEKVALKCDTAIESRQLIGEAGAEKIRQYGIAYLRSKGELYKIEVPMIPEEEIMRAVDYLKQSATLRIV